MRNFYLQIQPNLTCSFLERFISIRPENEFTIRIVYFIFVKNSQKQLF